MNLKHKLGAIITITLLLCSGLFINQYLCLWMDHVKASSFFIDESYDDFKNGTFNDTIIESFGNESILKLNFSKYEANLWLENRPKLRPEPRMGHAMATIWGTNKILLFGGANNQGGFTIFNDTWIFDYSEDSWMQITSLNATAPSTYYHAMTSIYGTDKVLLFGSFFTPFNNTMVFDLSEKTWTRKANLPAGGAINKAAMAMVYGTDKVALFGHFNNSNETWIYDLSNDTWEDKTPGDPLKSPPARFNHAMASIYGNKSVLLFGGSYWDGVEWHRYNDTWVYSLENNSWTMINTSQTPSAREHHALSTIYGQDRVLLYGGNYWTGVAYKTYNDTWIYSLGNRTWTNMGPIKDPGKKFAHAMATVYGTAIGILFGGIGESSGETNDTWSYGGYYYQDNGTYISSVTDIGANSSLKVLYWNASIFDDTSIKFQLRSSINESDIYLEDFLGPDGTVSSYYNDTPTKIWSGHSGERWVQYNVYFYTDYNYRTPMLKNITIIYNRWPDTYLVNPFDNNISSNNRPIFHWNFTDSDSTNQTRFQVIIDDDLNFNSIDYDSGLNLSEDSYWQFPDGTSYVELQDGIWFWKVRTKDNDGDWGLYSQPWKIIIDTITPNSEIQFPKNNTFYNKMNIIFGLANDTVNGTGINKVELAIKRLGDDSYWTGSTWKESESWLTVFGTTNWSFNSSSVLWYSGWEYLVMPRAMDNAFNFETFNKGRSFIYDIENVSYSNAFPMANEISNTTEVQVGINISDKASGVNASTIEYSISIDNGATWESWTPVTDLQNGNNIKIQLNLSFPNGTENSIKWRASDMVGNGPKGSQPYQININTWVDNTLDIPKVQLWSPPDDIIINEDAVNLSWFLITEDILNVKYDVYLDTVNPPQKRVGENLTYTHLMFEDLDNIITYYWTVLPKVDKINGKCDSGIWSFSVDIPLPKAILEAPENNSMVASTTPTLVWSLEYDGLEVITYDLYIGTIDQLELEYEKLPNKYLSIDIPLEVNTTYYWKIIPWVTRFAGIESETWTFTIQLENGGIPKFGLNLTLEPVEIEIQHSEVKIVKAIVKNLGELKDNFTISLKSHNDSRLNVYVSGLNTLEIEPGKLKTFFIKVSIKDNSDHGIINITVIARSKFDEEYGLNIEEKANLTVKIVNPQKPKDDKSNNVFFNWNLLIVLILIVIMIIIILILVKKRKVDTKKIDRNNHVDEPMVESTNNIQRDQQAELEEE